MFTGGNIGMVSGMFGGGLCAAQLGTESVPVAAAMGFAGMTIGMISGMVLGTWLTEKLFGVVRAAVALPRWLRGGSPRELTHLGVRGG